MDKGFMRKKSKWLWTILIVCYVGFIFNNSITPAVESSQQSGRVLSMIMAAFQFVGLDGGLVTEHFVRKTAHFTEYFLLGALLWNCLKSYMLTGKFWTALQLWLITVIPLTDETIQLFSEGRSGQVSDVWLDFSGAVVGSLCMLGVWHLIGRIREKRRKTAGSVSVFKPERRKKTGKG